MKIHTQIFKVSCNKHNNRGNKGVARDRDSARPSSKDFTEKVRIMVKFLMGINNYFKAPITNLWKIKIV